MFVLLLLHLGCDVVSAYKQSNVASTTPAGQVSLRWGRRRVCHKRSVRKINLKIHPSKENVNNNNKLLLYVCIHELHVNVKRYIFMQTSCMDIKALVLSAVVMVYFSRFSNYCQVDLICMSQILWKCNNANV